MNPQSWFPTAFAPNPNGGLNDLWQSFNDSQEASRNANAAMTQQTLGWWNGVMNKQEGALNQAAGYLQGTNKANIRDINKTYQKYAGKSLADMVGSGLGNSTIRYSQQTGIQNARSDALSRSRAEFGNRLYDAYSKNALANSGLASQQLNYLSQIDIGYPDMGAYAHMAAGMGGMGGGAPGGGGGGYIGDMSRPVGGPQPAWAKYGGQSGGMDMAGGGYGGPSMGGYSGAPYREIAPYDSGGGMWGPLYAAVQSGAMATGGLGEQGYSDYGGGGGDF